MKDKWTASTQLTASQRQNLIILLDTTDWSYMKHWTEHTDKNKRKLSHNNS